MNKQLSLLLCFFTYFAQTYTNDIDSQLSMILSPAHNSISTTKTPLIVGVILKNNGKPKKNETVTVFVDGLANGIVTTNNHGIFTYQIRSDMPLSNGKHFAYAVTVENNTYIKGARFTVQARSQETKETYKSGNVSATNSYIAYPTNGSYSSTNTPYIVAIALDSGNNPVGSEHMTYKMDSNTVASNCCASQLSNGMSSYVLTSGQALSDGVHTVDAHAVESNVDFAQQSFTVDTTPPSAPVTTSPTNNQTINSSTVIITGTAETDAQVLVYMDGDTFGQITYADSNGDWSIQFDGLTNDPHSFTTQQIDLAGNEGTVSNVINFTVNA